jgi:hypothetical protein
MKIGQLVECPADRGDKPYRARIEAISPQATHMGRVFRWITVRRLDGRPGGVWPSRRLGLIEKDKAP